MFGLPCAHIMQQMQQAPSLDDIHSQWCLDRLVILPLFLLLSLLKLEIQLYCREEEDPWGHPIILHVGTLLDLNWLKMWILGVVVVTVLSEERATTQRPVLNTPEIWQTKGLYLKSPPWKEHQLQILFL